MKKTKSILFMLNMIVLSFFLNAGYSIALADENNRSYIWPVPGFRTITSDYYDSEDRAHIHGAIDISGENILGAKVIAADKGTVIAANEDGWGGGYGTFLIIDHGNGKTSLYAHMSKIKVKKDDKIKRGQTIGYVGNTGDSTGPHLHFETRLNGVKYNPMDEFPEIN